MDISPNPPLPILIVDDESTVITGFQLMLESGGFNNTRPCQDSCRVMSIVEEQPLALILLDLSMPGVGGEELLGKLASDYPNIPVIIVTGQNDIETAIRCMRTGAFDYMVKPVEESRLVSAVSRAVELQELRGEWLAFRDRVFQGQLEHPEAFADIVTADPTMISIFQYIETVAHTSRPVLITGETGVGKELLARALYAVSGRRGPFVPVNIAGLDDNMFSDTLFGHVKGAFTGADKVRKGVIEQCAAGTVFLDEIGDLSEVSQVKLLRLLQEREYLPLGADVPKKAKCGFVLATNRELQALRDQGAFRADLYYRLQTHHIHVPPLRKRLRDLPPLVDALIGKAANDLGKRPPTPPPELVSLLATYHFPGNVRELEAMIYDAVSHHKTRMLSMDTFKEHIEANGSSAPRQEHGASHRKGGIFSLVDELPTLREAHDLLLEEAMHRANENQSIAARLLGISNSGLSKALKRMREQPSES